MGKSGVLSVQVALTLLWDCIAAEQCLSCSGSGEGSHRFRAGISRDFQLKSQVPSAAKQRAGLRHFSLFERLNAVALET